MFLAIYAVYGLHIIAHHYFDIDESKIITEENLDKYQFLISPNSFFQVNHHQTINLYNQIKTYLSDPK